jgi:ankyrin repeat protein
MDPDNLRRVVQAGVNNGYAFDFFPLANITRALRNDEEIWQRIVNVRRPRLQRTALMAAAACGHTDRLTWLAARGAAINENDEEASTALHASASRGKAAAVEKLLVDLHADVSARDRVQRTPLAVASMEGHDEAVSLLCEAGSHLSARDSYGFAPQHLACRQNHLAVMRILLVSDADVDLLTTQGESCLYMACEAGFEAIADELIRYGANLDPRNLGHFSPLHILAKHGFVGLMRKLVEAGADCNARNSQGWTPLFEAAQAGNFPAVECLVQQGKAHVNNSIFSPLGAALGSRHEKLALFLLEKGASLCQSDLEVAPLISAAAYGLPKVVDALLARGDNPNAENDDGDTPLGAACGAVSRSGGGPYYSAPTIVRALLARGAEVNHLNAIHATALHYAAASGFDELVSLLISEGASVYACTSRLNFILHYACREAVEKPLCPDDSEAVVRRLIQAGAPMNVKNSNGETPLHLCCAEGFTNLASILLEAGADVTILNAAGKTPADVAKENGFRALANELEGVDEADENGEDRDEGDEREEEGHGWVFHPGHDNEIRADGFFGGQFGGFVGGQ